MHLLSINDLSASEINEIFRIADAIKDNPGKQKVKKLILALLFEKPSTRTRVSFESAAMQLGGNAIYIDSRTTQLSRGEEIGDVARVLSMYVSMIAARLFKQSDIIELARYSKVPVINALTDLEHPTQALTDLYTIREEKGRVKDLEIAFLGDIAANTANSLMLCGAKLGARIVLVGPKGCTPNEDFVSAADKSSQVKITDDIKEGLSNADVVYTDTFISMGQESEVEKRRRLFKDYQLNKRILGYAKPDAIVMHCLPAHRNEEITAEVLEGKQSVVWQQAANKLLLEKAVIVYLSEKAYSKG